MYVNQYYRRAKKPFRITENYHQLKEHSIMKPTKNTFSCRGIANGELLFWVLLIAGAVGLVVAINEFTKPTLGAPAGAIKASDSEFPFANPTDPDTQEYKVVERGPYDPETRTRLLFTVPVKAPGTPPDRRVIISTTSQVDRDVIKAKKIEIRQQSGTTYPRQEIVPTDEK